MFHEPNVVPPPSDYAAEKVCVYLSAKLVLPAEWGAQSLTQQDVLEHRSIFFIYFFIIAIGLYTAADDTLVKVDLLIS